MHDAFIALARLLACFTLTKARTHACFLLAPLLQIHRASKQVRSASRFASCNASKLACMLHLLRLLERLLQANDFIVQYERAGSDFIVRAGSHRVCDIRDGWIPYAGTLMNYFYKIL